jgi:hypothetical protein
MYSLVDIRDAGYDVRVVRSFGEEGRWLGRDESFALTNVVSSAEP